MTVATTTNRVSYACDGATTVFPYTFKIFEDSDLEVILREIATGAETTLTLTTHYTVSGAGDASGGNVTTVATYSNAYTLVIRRVLDLVQETDYIEGDSFPANSHEDALDRLVMLAQQLSEELGRALKLAVTSSYSDLEIPDPEEGKLLGWSGSVLVNTEFVESGNLTAHDNAATAHDAIKASAAETAAGNSASLVLTPAGLAGFMQYQTAFIPAGAFMELGGNNSGTIDNQTFPESENPIDYIEFGYQEDWEGAQVRVGLPMQWDQGVIKGRVEWMPNYATPVQAGSEVCFGLQCAPVRDARLFDRNLATPPAYVGDTAVNTATGYEYRTGATANFASSAGTYPTLDIRLTRNNATGGGVISLNNNATAPVWVTGIWLQFRCNSEVTAW